MSKSTGDYAWFPLRNRLFLVVFLIIILNKHYGLITKSIKIYAQLNGISRTQDGEEGKGLQRGPTWVPSTVHFTRWQG